MTTIVAYDSFARGGLVREPFGSGACDWCGQRRRVIYHYYPENPAFHLPPRALHGGKAFCNLCCYRSYNS